MDIQTDSQSNMLKNANINEQININNQVKNLNQPMQLQENPQAQNDIFRNIIDLDKIGLQILKETIKIQKFDQQTIDFTYKQLLKVKDKLVKSQFQNGVVLGSLFENHKNKIEQLKNHYNEEQNKEKKLSQNLSSLSNQYIQKMKILEIQSFSFNKNQHQTNNKYLTESHSSKKRYEPNYQMKDSQKYNFQEYKQKQIKQVINEESQHQYEIRANKIIQDSSSYEFLENISQNKHQNINSTESQNDQKLLNRHTMYNECFDNDYASINQQTTQQQQILQNNQQNLFNTQNSQYQNLQNNLFYQQQQIQVINYNNQNNMLISNQTQEAESNKYSSQSMIKLLPFMSDINSPSFKLGNTQNKYINDILKQFKAFQYIDTRETFSKEISITHDKIQSDNTNNCDKQIRQQQKNETIDINNQQISINDSISFKQEQISQLADKEESVDFQYIRNIKDSNPQFSQQNQIQQQQRNIQQQNLMLHRVMYEDEDSKIEYSQDSDIINERRNIRSKMDFEELQSQKTKSTAQANMILSNIGVEKRIAINDVLKYQNKGRGFQITRQPAQQSQLTSSKEQIEKTNLNMQSLDNKNVDQVQSLLNCHNYLANTDNKIIADNIEYNREILHQMKEEHKQRTINNLKEQQKENKILNNDQIIQILNSSQNVHQDKINIDNSLEESKLNITQTNQNCHNMKDDESIMDKSQSFITEMPKTQTKNNGIVINIISQNNLPSNNNSVSNDDEEDEDDENIFEKELSAPILKNLYNGTCSRIDQRKKLIEFLEENLSQLKFAISEKRIKNCLCLLIENGKFLIGSSNLDSTRNQANKLKNIDSQEALEKFRVILQEDFQQSSLKFVK